MRHPRALTPFFQVAQFSPQLAALTLHNTPLHITIREQQQVSVRVPSGVRTPRLLISERPTLKPDTSALPQRMLTQGSVAVTAPAPQTPIQHLDQIGELLTVVVPEGQGSEVQTSTINGRGLPTPMSSHQTVDLLSVLQSPRMPALRTSVGAAGLETQDGGARRLLFVRRGVLEGAEVPRDRPTPTPPH
jgi:hypothetical protein